MRIPSPTLLLLLILSAGFAHAQNAAPVQGDTKNHVTPGQGAAAANKAQQASSTQKSGAAAPEGKPVVLDSVVAVVNGDVLLQSDVEAERRFESLQLLPANENTDVRAAEHLITRTLILQQMKEQDGGAADVKDSDVDKFIAELKHQLPGCLPTRCQSDAGWASYLGERGMSAQEVRERWRQRLIILDYLNQRFRGGIRIAPAEVQTYYDKTLVPQFTAKHEKAPALKTLQPRIEEILLQEQVSKQIDDWEATLRQEGSVEILVPAYGQSNQHAQDDDDVPGGGA